MSTRKPDNPMPVKMYVVYWLLLLLGCYSCCPHNDTLIDRGTLSEDGKKWLPYEYQTPMVFVDDAGSQHSATVDTVRTNMVQHCTDCCNACQCYGDRFERYESKTTILTSDIYLSDKPLRFNINLSAYRTDTILVSMSIGTDFFDDRYHQAFWGNIIADSTMQYFVPVGDPVLHGIHFTDVFARKYPVRLVNPNDIDSVYYSKEKGLLRLVTIGSKSFTRVN